MDNNIESPSKAAKVPSDQEKVTTITATESAEKFQEFIHDLFDKNGVLNDLRAYLRGHIVEVLKSAQTGVPPICQKHFTQRLDLNHQAMNILIAEYLLRFEFSYTVSVFVSELPMANMVFDFARTLFQKTEEPTHIRFTDQDVCSILNYLGIKCDSQHALFLMETYKKEAHTPLLLVILNCIAFYRNDKADISSSSSQSSVTLDSAYEQKKTIDGKCGHLSVCRICQMKFTKLKDKTRRMNLCIKKNKGSVESMNVAPFVQKIGTVERKIVDEMFLQLKSVYDTELEALKAEEDRKLRHSLVLQALQLHQRKLKMDEAFNQREKELEKTMQQKKKFLWGLARALREQHAQMARAMQAVKCETAKLEAKEDSLKTQLAEAQEILRTRGEEMRQKISDELVALEGHLEAMRSERERIRRERFELEQLKNESLGNTKMMNIQKMEAENEDIRHHYELLKNELTILKKYLEMTKVEPKCVVDKGTVTEVSQGGSKASLVLNNEQDLERYLKEEDRLPTQLVNEFKKPKNVNFSQENEKCGPNLSELYRERSTEQRSSESSLSFGDIGALKTLRDENQRLKCLAQKQSEKISLLMDQQARLQAGLRSVAQSRTNTLYLQTDGGVPREPPPRPQSASVGCRAGAGEELAGAGGAQPRILVPGDALPFVGVLGDRHNDNRRQAAYAQLWRARRASPPAGPSRRPRSPARHTPDRTESGPTTISSPRSPDPSTSTSDAVPPRDAFSSQPIVENASHLHPRLTAEAEQRHREKSPRSVLREAKEKLRSKPATPPVAREKSPSSVLREAKMRLRKLEIEAEAVEKSYLDFRMRQSALRDDRALQAEEDVTKDMPELGVRFNRSLHKMDYSKTEPVYTLQNYPTIPDTDKYNGLAQDMKKDFDTYISKFETKLNLQDSYFKNKNTTAQKTRPVPQAYSSKPESAENQQANLAPEENYIEKPLTEFRKLYNSNSPRPYWEEPLKVERSRSPSPSNIIRSISPAQTFKEAKEFEANNVEVPTITGIEENKTLAAKKEALKKAKDKKQAELEILKTNLTKIYNLKEIPVADSKNDDGATDSSNVADKSNIQTKTEMIENPKPNRIGQRNETQNANDNKTKVAMPDKNSHVTEPNLADATEMSESEYGVDRISGNMTILISPKRSDAGTQKPRSPERKRSLSPEQAAKLTRNDVLEAIFDAKKDSCGEISSVLIKNQHFESKGNYYGVNSLSDDAGRYADEYEDDLINDYGKFENNDDYNNDDSPISLAKQQNDDDDPFWDS